MNPNSWILTIKSLYTYTCTGIIPFSVNKRFYSYFPEGVMRLLTVFYATVSVCFNSLLIEKSCIEKKTIQTKFYKYYIEIEGPLPFVTGSFYVFRKQCFFKSNKMYK